MYERNKGKVRMDFYGELYLRISGNNLDFKKIDTDLELKATKCVTKGTRILNTHFAEIDVWLYEEKIINLPSLNDKLFDILNKLLIKKDIINDIKNDNEIAITVDIRSDDAQIGFEINNNNISMLSRLNLGLSFNILSFGLVSAT